MTSHFSASIFELLGLFGCLVLCGTFVKWAGSCFHNPPYPPGPKGILIVGNTFDIPSTNPWLTYTRWAKKFGSVIHIRDFMQHTIIINSLDDAIELFERRSRNYSDRPVSPMISLMGWDFGTAFSNGDKWKRHRRVYQQNLRQDALQVYYPMHTQKINDMLRGLLSTPEEFRMHFRTFVVAGAIIMSTLYGHDIAPRDDYYVTLAEQAMEKLSEGYLPGVTLIALPVLRHLPSWFPGTRFKRIAEENKALTDQMQDAPIELVKKTMAMGSATSALAAKLLENNKAQGGSQGEEELIKAIMASAYAGGADTTVSSIATFSLAMICNPEAQKKAQAEIDSVVGTRRLPSYDDRSSMPYVEALYREVMRWRPVGPLSLFHTVTEDDTYKGYFIPKSAIVIPNIWAMSHDDSVYSNPELFCPERFLTESGDLIDDRLSLAFGLGRRICPGRHLANATLWLSVVSILSVFNLSKAKDGDGNEIPVQVDYTDGVVVHPLPFRCTFTPRSDMARNLIVETELC